MCRLLKVVIMHYAKDLVSSMHVLTSNYCLVRLASTKGPNLIPQPPLLFGQSIMCIQRIYIFKLNTIIAVKFKKNQFFVENIIFLGFKLTTTILIADDEKVRVIWNFPSLKNTLQVKGFIVLANLYNKFVDVYSDLVEPIINLTSKKINFTWTEKVEIIYRQ